MNLADEIEGAEGPSRELDRLIAFFVGHKYGRIGEWANRDNGDYVVLEECAARYTSSIDAAMTLVEGGEVEAALCAAMLRCGQFLGNVTAADLPRFICSTALRGEG